MKYNIERVTRDEAIGWAFGDSGPALIEAFIEDRKIAARPTAVRRGDVHDGHPNSPHSEWSGFRIRFPETPLDRKNPLASLRLVISADGASEAAEFAVPAAIAAKPSALKFWRARRSPFPPSVMAAIEGGSERKWRDVRQWGGDEIANAVDVLLFLLRTGSRATPGLFSYFSTLSRLARSFEFTAANFPTKTSATGNAAPGVASSPQEHFLIAHHLWTLKGHGVEGDLVEFGCFKGFSTSCLSFACRMVGIGMHVFDSFAGLPPSDSRVYTTGEFCGGFDEVVCNVTNFGCPEVIVFHKGFFSDTVASAGLGKIACIWMDVDLESSAKDALAVLPGLHPMSCVFTHESAPHDFDAAQNIVSTPNPEAVLPPIRDAFLARNVKPHGRYLAGATGVVWDSEKAIPTPGPAMLRLYQAMLQ